VLLDIETISKIESDDSVETRNTKVGRNLFHSMNIISGNSMESI